MHQQILLEYRAILENASIGILFSRDRKVLHCNPKLNAIFGYGDGELIDKPGSIFYLNDEDYVRMGRMAGPGLTRGETVSMEYTMRRKDGSPVMCQLRITPVNPLNTDEGTVWMIEDITDLKRAQDVMRELSHKQEAILENASVGIMFTRNGLIELANPHFDSMLGWQHGTLLGQRARVFFVSDDDYVLFGQTVGARLSQGELVDIQWLNARKDGSPIWCRHMAKAVTTASGNQSTIWITEDISDKKAASDELHSAHQELENRVLERTRELQDAHQRMQAVIESSPLAIYTRDLQGQLTSWNAAAESIFGRRRDEALGRKLDFILSDGVSQSDALLCRVMAGETILGLELAGHMQDGPEIEISVSFVPLNDEFGKLSGVLTMASDISERKANERKVAWLAYHDALTGLPNRLLLEDRLKQAMAQADRSRSKVALLFLDLDNFKRINDTLGHAVGDLLLKEVSTRLRGCVRDTDTISRQGGDEFVLLLGELAESDAAMPAISMVLQRLDEPFFAEGHELSTSASIGVTLYPDDGQDFDTLRKKADMAMYRAKEAGRNTYRFFDEAMNVEALEHLQLRNGLRRALDRHELVLHYQPQVDLRTQRVIGAEALIRWNHPELGMVSPGRFIPVAEDSGLIVPIGEWVIGEACRQAVAWQGLGLPALLMAVNLSAVQFKRGNVEDTVTQALAASGLAPHLLELELTESILVQNVEQVLATLKRIKALGVKLSIDDFGTGYSSLSYLKRFDIDKLKIDQSFIRDLATDPDDAAIVNAIIQMARSLGLRTIAEGVETADMLHRLQGFGCDEAQGYYLARPMPADEFPAYFLTVASHVIMSPFGAGHCSKQET